MSHKGVFLPSTIVGVAAIAMLVRSHEPPVLLAEAGHLSAVYDDQDADGLPDSQELVMGTNPLLTDSDNDSYSDLEEFARQSDPNDSSSHPSAERAAVGLTSREEDGVFYLSTAFYLEDSLLDGGDIQVGLMLDGDLVHFPINVLIGQATISTHVGADSDDTIILIQSPLPVETIYDLGEVSLWSTVTPPGTEEPVSSDALNVVADEEREVLLEFTLVDGPPPGGMYKPLTVPAEIPASWNSGQICIQASVNVGNIGPVVQHIVEAASCVEADAFCSPSCSNLAGSSMQVVDPIALLGG